MLSHDLAGPTTLFPGTVLCMYVCVLRVGWAVARWSFRVSSPSNRELLKLGSCSPELLIKLVPGFRRHFQPQEYGLYYHVVGYFMLLTPNLL